MKRVWKKILYISLIVTFIFCINTDSYAAEEIEEVRELPMGHTEESETLSRLAKSNSTGTHGTINWSYDNATGTLKLTGSGEITAQYNTLPWYAYKGEIKKVEIGNGITELGTSAFYTYSALQEVTFPNTLKKIGVGAFAECISLSKVELNSGLEQVSGYAFQSCPIDTMEFPSSLTTIYATSFYNCTKLRTITVAAGNQDYSAVAGILYSKDKKRLIYSPLGIQAGSVMVPSGVRVIAGYAFLDSPIHTVSFPDTLEEIGEGAFGRSKLTTVTIPSSVKELDYLTFSECNSLTTVTSAVQEIWIESFAKCVNLKKVVLKEGTKKIRTEAFRDCTSLSEVSFPKTLEEIQTYAFYGCKQLKNVSFKEGLKKINNYAFWNTGITSVKLPSSVQGVGTKAFPDNVKITDLTAVGNGSYTKTTSLYVKAKEDYKQAFEVLQLVNQERTKVGKAALVMDKELLEAAMTRAAEITIYFSHARPIGQMCTSISSKLVGENIAIGQKNASEAVKSWMNSAGHKENILDAGYTSIGIGCVKVDGYYYWVQAFGETQAGTVKASTYRNATRTVGVAVYPNEEIYANLSATVNKSSLKAGKTAIITYYCNNGYKKVPIEAKSFTFVSGSKKVATISSSGKITGVSKGSATITIYPKGYSDFKRTVKIKVTGTSNNVGDARISYKKRMIYNGAVHRPSVAVKVGSKKLALNVDYTVNYKNNKKIGNAKIIIKGKEKYKGSITKTFQIVPKTRKIKSLKNNKKQAISLKWNGNKKDVSGYQIQVSTTKSMSKAMEYTAKAKANKMTIQGLKSKTTHYIRVRGYKKASGKKYYGSWSKIKSLKVK